jgi:hypothetical protein
MGTKYLDSLATFEAMRTAVGARAVPFILDDLIDFGGDYLARVLRRLPFGQGALPAIDPTQKANTFDGRYPRATLSPADTDYLDRTPKLVLAFDAFRARHGMQAALPAPV